MGLDNVSFGIISSYFILKYIWGQLDIMARGGGCSSGGGGSFPSPHEFPHFLFEGIKRDYMQSPRPKFIGEWIKIFFVGVYAPDGIYLEINIYSDLKQIIS